MIGNIVTASIPTTSTTTWSYNLAPLVEQNKVSMPMGYSFDINLPASNTLASTIDVILSNDDPATTTFAPAPALSFTVTAGNFSTGGKKMTVDSGKRVLTRYIGIRVTVTTASTPIIIDGVTIY
jgi:hypothetical protein